MTTTEAPVKLQSLKRRPVVLKILLIALLAEIGYAVLNISTMPVYLKYERQFGESVISWVLVAFLLSEALFKGPMGHLADKFGRRRLMMIGPGLTVFTSLATLFVPHGWAFETGGLLILRALDGVGAAMLWPAAFALMSDSVEDNQRQEAMSLLNLCYLLGVALALPIGGLVNDLAGSRAASLYLAAGFFLLVSLGIRFFIASDRIKHKTEAGEVGEVHVGEFIETARSIPAYLILSLVTFAGIGFPMAIIKLFAEQQFKMSETQFGFMIVLPAAIAMAVLSVPMSKYGEKIGRPKAVHLGMGLCALGLAVISLGAFSPLFRSPFLIAIGGLPVGVGFLLAIPAWMASVSDLNPRRRAVNLGAVMTAQGLGAIIGAPIGGYMYQELQKTVGPDFGRYSPFLGCTLCVTLGFILSLKILR